MDERPFEGWFCLQAGEVLGPLSRAQLRKLEREGRLGPEDTLWGQRLPDGELLDSVTSGDVLRRDRFAVLVVDDNLVAASGLVQLLYEWGADHCVACTGAEALRAATALEPDVVFLDLDLPFPAGYALAVALRNLPRLPRIVILTADDSAPRWKKLQDGGFHHCLAKPADLDRLREVLWRLGKATPPRGVPS
jgi:CheY-like chemotaxis protein